MIELIQLAVERYRHEAVDLVNSRASPSLPSDFDRERVKSDDTLDRSERKKGPVSVSVSGTACPLPALLQSAVYDEEKNRMKPLVDVIKAGLNCLTRFYFWMTRA